MLHYITRGAIELNAWVRKPAEDALYLRQCDWELMEAVNVFIVPVNP